MYQRTQRMIIDESKWRPLNSLSESGEFPGMGLIMRLIPLLHHNRRKEGDRQTAAITRELCRSRLGRRHDEEMKRRYTPATQLCVAGVDRLETEQLIVACDHVRETTQPRTEAPP